MESRERRVQLREAQQEPRDSALTLGNKEHLLPRSQRNRHLRAHAEGRLSNIGDQRVG